MLIESSGVKTSILESMIGKLNHVVYIIPLSRYFLNRLRDTLTYAIQRKHSFLTLGERSKEYLKLWLEFLSNASKPGININNMTFTIPNAFLVSDACTRGLGGYTSNGYAWRFLMPEDEVRKHSINFL